MLGDNQEYKIPEVKRYNLAEARGELYRNAPSTNYGIREKVGIDYRRICF